MFGVGFSEIIFIVILAIVILGPEHLPELGTKLGRIFRHYRNLRNDFTLRMRDAMAEDQPRKDQTTTIVETQTEVTKNTTQTGKNKND